MEEIMIYTFLADGFEEIEALCPIDMLRRAGLDVTTIAVHPDPQNTDRLVTGSHGIGVMADRSYTEMAAQSVPEDLEMVILPGGMPGAKHLDGSALVERYLKTADAKGAYMAAICAAPMVLGKRGYLAGKKAVCYPGFEEYLQGAEVCSCAVAVDGKRHPLGKRRSGLCDHGLRYGRCHGIRRYTDSSDERSGKGRGHSQCHPC